MIELRFDSGGSYGASTIYEDDNYCLLTGTDSKGNKIAIVSIKKLDIHLVGDEELYLATLNNENVVQKACGFILSRLTPEKFMELIERLVAERYEQGLESGKTSLQRGLQQLLGLDSFPVH